MMMMKKKKQGCCDQRQMISCDLVETIVERNHQKSDRLPHEKGN